jgi:hypothetical protein
VLPRLSELKRGTLYLLACHFFDRFFDTEALSPGGEPETNVVQLLGFLAVPSAFFIILCQPMVMVRWDLVAGRNFFVSFSMIVMGFVMVFEWDALFPDRRDYQILTPLPIPLRTLFVAKMAALAFFLGIFLVDMNFFGVLMWPSLDTRGNLVWIMGTHLLVVAAAGLWAALAAAAVQGVLVTVLGGTLFRRVSVVIQTLLMATLVMLLCVAPWIGPVIRGLVWKDSPLLYYYPGFWFVGLYERLRPAVDDPTLIKLGHFATQALAWTTVIFLLTYLPLYRRHARKMLETPAPSPAGPGRLSRWIASNLDRTILRQPVQRAVFHFISQAISRSVKHRLFLATYSGFGAALAILSFDPNGQGLLRLPLTLSFVLVSGLRAAFNFPAEINANWIYRISETDYLGQYLAATRKWIAVCGIFPLFLLLAPIELANFPWRVALFHLAYGITLSVLLTEVLFFGFRKVPFTCAHFPGRINLVWLSVVYVLGFTAYSSTMASAELWLIERPGAALAFFICALLARTVLAWFRERGVRRTAALDYLDAGDPEVRALGLTPQ